MYSCMYDMYERKYTSTFILRALYEFYDDYNLSLVTNIVGKYCWNKNETSKWNETITRYFFVCFRLYRTKRIFFFHSFVSLRSVSMMSLARHKRKSFYINVCRGFDVFLSHFRSIYTLSGCNNITRVVCRR